MTPDQFKKLLKEGVVEVFHSDEVKELIKEGSLEALRSDKGQEAIVGALKSDKGQEAIKRAALNAFGSKEGKEIFAENFAEAFHDVAGPILDNHDSRLKKMEAKQLVN